MLTVIQLIYHKGLIILELIKLSTINIVIRILYYVICSYNSILIYFYYLSLLCGAHNVLDSNILFNSLAVTQCGYCHLLATHGQITHFLEASGNLAAQLTYLSANTYAAK